jgi:hypothetical protein
VIANFLVRGNNAVCPGISLTVRPTLQHGIAHHRALPAHPEFKFIGTDTSTHPAGELRFAVTGATRTTVTDHLVGDGVSDFHILLGAASPSGPASSCRSRALPRSVPTPQADRS